MEELWEKKNKELTDAKDLQVAVFFSNSLTETVRGSLCRQFSEVDSKLYFLTELFHTNLKKVASLIVTRSAASNLEQVANLLCDQANSASYPHLDEILGTMVRKLCMTG